MRPALEAQTRPHRSHVNPERFAGVGGAAGAGVGADEDERATNSFMRIILPDYASLQKRGKADYYRGKDRIRGRKKHHKAVWYPRRTRQRQS
ncbi:hypothetical protein M8J75_016445 [Diaphorina citri]|nr:hypothetical protein M8J75_016445 [Diaphorina citri]